MILYISNGYIFLFYNFFKFLVELFESRKLIILQQLLFYWHTWSSTLIIMPVSQEIPAYY